MAVFNLIAYGGTGLGYGREAGYSFVADARNTARVAAQDDDRILNDWTDGEYRGTKTEGIYEGDTGSTVVSSGISWLGDGEMITSGVWYELSYTDPTTDTPATVDVFLIWNDTTNDWGGFDNSYVLTTAPLSNGVTYTVTAVSNNAGVPWDVLVCFAAGTRIQTESGPVAVENLRVGDSVLTLDHGPQPVRWVGARRVAARGAFAPICIRRDALGNTRDLYVSPQHRMLLSHERAELYFGATEVLVAAKHLVNGDTILPVPGGMITYYHLLFDSHEILLSEGIPSESLHPNPQSLRGVSAHSRREILTLFPEIERHPCRIGALARPSLKRSEAALLADAVPPRPVAATFDC